MKRTVIVAAALAVGAAAWAHEAHKHAQPAPAAAPSVDAEIVKTLAAYRAAFEARSTDKLGEVVDPDLLVLEGTTKNVGWPDYRDNHIGPEMKEWESLAYADVKVVDWEVNGDLGWAATTAAVTIVSGGKPMTLDVAESFVLGRRAGSWRIRHIHWSGRRRPEAKSAEAK